MELIAPLAIVAVIIIFIVSANLPKSSIKKPYPPYVYTRKQSVMTSSEAVFYKRLQAIVNGKYIIFPQIHLSALGSNRTQGRYRMAGFQRINRRSVDYILVDPDTLQTVYAVELDDSTHDTEKGRAVDALKSEILRQINIPLVRFRNTQTLSDEDIVRAFSDAHNALEA